MVAVSGPWFIRVVFWNEIDVAAKANARRARRRTGKRSRIGRRIGGSYVTVIVKFGPAIAGGVLLPAQTPIVIGVVVGLFAGSEDGTPIGVWNPNPLLVDGQAPEASVLVTETLSGAVPWLSIQKYSS